MADYRDDPLTPQDEVDLAPLRESHEATDLESELKGLFIAMFEAFARAGEREVNTLGTPHLGPFSQVERAVKNEGLALYRSSDEDAMRYLFRAWRARNPKRGLHMLRVYLQVLWPNGWTVEQMYQTKGQPYPQSLWPNAAANRYRTSRVRVGIESPDTTGDDVLAAVPALRSVVPARILLEFVMLTRIDGGQAAVAAGFWPGFQFQRFEGTLT